jgi:DNA-binding NtrC family response regulator
MVIDDEPLVLSMVSDMLTERGYRVSTFERPLKALDFFNEQWHSVDAIITDMVMPEMTGRDLYLKMRALNPRIKAILSSGYSLQSQSQTIFEEGIKAFIQKPYRQEQLLNTVAEVLSQPNQT